MNSIQGAISITRKIVELLAIIDIQAYGQPLPLFNGSTLGQHFRHIFDFYHCLVRDGKSGVIDYAARERRPGIESDPLTARQAFEAMIDSLTALMEGDSVVVRADFSEQPEEQRPLYQSSIGRELMFAYDHAIHHLAIIRMGLQMAFPQYCRDESLGMAPATVKYRAGSRSAEQ